MDNRWISIGLDPQIPSDFWPMSVEISSADQSKTYLYQTSFQSVHFIHFHLVLNIYGHITKLSTTNGISLLLAWLWFGPQLKILKTYRTHRIVLSLMTCHEIKHVPLTTGNLGKACDTRFRIWCHAVSAYLEQYNFVTVAWTDFLEVKFPCPPDGRLVGLFFIIGREVSLPCFCHSTC